MLLYEVSETPWYRLGVNMLRANEAIIIPGIMNRDAKVNEVLKYMQEILLY